MGVLGGIAAEQHHRIVACEYFLQLPTEQFSYPAFKLVASHGQGSGLDGDHHADTASGAGLAVTWTNQHHHISAGCLLLPIEHAAVVTVVMQSMPRTEGAIHAAQVRPRRMWAIAVSSP